MTQQLGLCLLKMLVLLLLFFLLFEPMACQLNDYYNTRQDRASYIDTTQYYTENFGEAPSVNRRNFEYQQYRPQQQLQQQQQQRTRELIFGPAQYQRRQVYADSQPQETQQRTLTAARAPFPYQDMIKPIESNMELDDRIRSIFHVGNDPGTHLFNTTLETNFNSTERMHSDESSSITSIENGVRVSKSSTTSSESLSSSSSSSKGVTQSSNSSTPSSSSSSSTLVPSSMPAMNNSEPTFKVQRTPDGKLSLVFNESSLQQATTTTNQQPKQSSTQVHKRPDIIYPDQSPANTTFNGCDFYEGQSLCKKVRNYPKLLHLDRILKQEFTQLGLFFAEDLELPLNVKQRFGGDPDEIDPCDSEERIIYPEAGMTKDLRWMLIVNDNTTYKQGVRIEECSGKDRPCNVIHQNLPNHYTSVCRQHYNYRQLVAITDTGRVVKDHFKVPSCCKCMLRNVSPF